MDDDNRDLHRRSSTWHTVGVEDFTIPPGYVEQLKSHDLESLCARTLSRPVTDRTLALPFLSFELLVRLDNGCVLQLRQGKEEPLQDSLLELLTLVYLLNAVAVPLADEMIGARDLKDAQFFQGPHELKTRPLLDRYGHDAVGFRTAVEQLGGTSLPLADAAYCLMPFPRIPLYYLLWERDDEFEPRFTILFDRTIERHFAADAIWGLVNWVSDALALDH